MINIIIFSCVCLTAALFFLGFMCYYIVKMNRLMTNLQLEFVKNAMLMQTVSSNIMEVKLKIEEQFDTLKNISKTSSTPRNTSYVPGESIEHNYERAKNLLKRGVSLDRELMTSCKMTEEEFELLSGAMAVE